jgi:hypothetical protein
VHKNESDIFLIRKYLNGELDARAMHQLEKRAQDDPFLMDAIEGYQEAGNNQQVQLESLKGSLAQRLAKKQTRIIPWRTLAIAASVLIVLTAGGIWYFNADNTTGIQKTAQLTKPEPEAKLEAPVAKPAATDTLQAKTATPELVAAVNEPKHVQKHTKTAVASNSTLPDHTIVNEIASANPAIKDTVEKDTTPLNEMVVMGYATQKKKDVTGNSDKSRSSAVLKEVQLEAKVQGVQVNPADAHTSGYLDSSGKIIKGRVIGKDDRQPIIGATIRLAGTNKAAVTDGNGKFSLPADSTHSKLVIASIGYNTMQVNTRNSDSLKKIALEPNSSSLNEVVVTHSGSQKKDEDVVIVAAHPENGWAGFKSYLKEKAISPDGKIGVVKLSFTLGTDGSISDIKVIKGLSPLTNAKAIDLLNNGPDWAGSTSHEPEKITLRVKFNK